METETTEIPLEYQVFALAFKEAGAISAFREDLPTWMVGAIHGQTGLHEFYQALVDFYDKTGLDPVDPIAFRAWLESETEIYDALGGVGGMDVFMEMVMSLDLSTPESVAKVLKHRANKRRQLDKIQELQTLINNKTHKSEEDYERIATLTDQIRSLESDLDYDPLANITTAIQIAERAEELLDVPDFLPTPFKSLNRAMGYTDDGGYFRGAVHAVVAQSGFGKSTFTKCLVNHWADLGYSTLFVNFEEARAHWERILMTQIVKENVYAKSSVWTNEEKQEKMAIFRAKLGEWGERFMVRHDPDTSYYDDLEKWLRDILGHQANVPDVVVIDTIQSMFTKSSGGKPRWAEFEQIMVRLERLAKDMDAVFIITAQQNSNAMKEKREVIEQSDTGGSLTIVQKSAVVTFITPKKLAGDDSDDEYLMQLQIPKNRITGSTFILDPPLVKYNDETKSYEEVEAVDEAYYEEMVSMNDLTEDFHS